MKWIMDLDDVVYIRTCFGRWQVRLSCHEKLLPSVSLYVLYGLLITCHEQTYENRPCNADPKDWY